MMLKNELSHAIDVTVRSTRLGENPLAEDGLDG
jgi:hypothetical protein